MCEINYIQYFMRFANELQSRGMVWDKTKINGLNIVKNLNNMAEGYLGSKMNELTDDISLREFILTGFNGLNTNGGTNLVYFSDSLGVVKFDIPHALSFYHELERVGHPNKTYGLGLLYLAAARQIEKEFYELGKVSSRGKISPIFVINAELFKWKRCNHVLRKYMLNLTVPEGYKGYYFEKKNLGLLAYLISCGYSFEEANKYLENKNVKMFYKHLDTDTEGRLVEEILTGELVDLNGKFAPKVASDFVELKAKFGEGVDDVNPFSRKTKKIMIEVMGKILHGVMTEIENNPKLVKSDAIVYNLGLNRFGIAVKEGFSKEEIFGDFSKYMKEVKNIDINDIIFGEYL